VLYQDVSPDELLHERFETLLELTTPARTPYRSGDWIADFAAMRAHTLWRIDNREYPSPIRDEET
jgi:hypothetical protein